MTENHVETPPVQENISLHLLKYLPMNHNNEDTHLPEDTYDEDTASTSYVPYNDGTNTEQPHQTQKDQ